jgi:Peptidase_C39 like family
VELDNLGLGGDAALDVPDVPDIRDTSWLDVPAMLDVLPDGRETIVIGDVHALSEGHHRQGENLHGFGQTCGICSCEAVLRRFGVDVIEAQLVEHALVRGECHVADDPAESGGTTLADQVRILSDFGVQARFEWADSVEELVQHVEHDRGVIIAVNAGELWDDRTYSGDGGANHAVVVTGVAQDPETGDIQGVFVNDSGSGVARRLLDVVDLRWSWLEAGGSYLVTDLSAADLTRRDIDDE